MSPANCTKELEDHHCHARKKAAEPAVTLFLISSPFPSDCYEPLFYVACNAINDE
jgi:hypothetical protein